MNAVELMVNEHKNIKRVLKVIRKLCIKISNGENIDYSVFYKIIDFVRNYADKHHHNKEEEILFKKMTDELGESVAGGPIFGMLSEHDLGRLYMQNLEAALKKVQEGDRDARIDVIANAVSYTDLLYRHIDKEDNAVYKFAEKQLSKEALEEVEERCKDVEKIAEEKRLQDKYLNIVKELEKLVE